MRIDPGSDSLFSIYDLRPDEEDPRRVISSPGAVVDTFAGPGGWDEGLRLTGYTGPVVGIEWESGACATAEAAGHLRIQADVAAYPVEELDGAVGLISSPPCPSFSMAGARSGHHDLPLVRDRIRAFANGGAPGDADWADERSKLTAEPMRWARALQPQWIALEQVPAVRPVWEEIAALLAQERYSVWTGLVNAADYGVPQVRKRAVLLASRDRVVSAPQRTHAENPTGGELPWVSMAQAIGWGMTDRPYFTLASSRNTGGPDKEKVGGSASRKALYAERDAGRWIVPATEARFSDGSIRVSLVEAAAMQSFRPDYPWRGNDTTQYQQVTNAVPPLLAAAALRQLVEVEAVAPAA